MSIRVVGTKQNTARNVLSFIQNHGAACPCHGCQSTRAALSSRAVGMAFRAMSQEAQAPEKEYAFEMAASNIRYGPGATAEVGFDFKHLNAKKVAVFTDQTILGLAPAITALASLEKQGIQYEIYSDVIIEPKDYGVKDAIQWARNSQPDAYLAVGGGSVMDTAKIANLFQAYPQADLLDFVNAPIGKGLPITRALKPLIAIPTTAGTGSETTGTAIFDLTTVHSKTGIASRALKPTLGIVDPLNTRSMPASVKASSGLDVLCHSLESYTAIPYNERTPRPKDPILRPAYQGANPISDIFSLAALRMVAKYLPRSVRDPDDFEAQEQTLLAATLAGIGFGNAGVHLCHGISYPIASQNPGYLHHGYEMAGHPIIPHGVSVAITSPAVFKFTGASSPERHLQAAEALGADISNVKRESAGEVLSEVLMDFLHNKLGSPQPRGLKDLGYVEADIDKLVQGALPQRRVLNLAPQVHSSTDESVQASLRKIISESMSY